MVQWDLDVMKCQGTGKSGLLNQGFITSRFFFHIIFYCDFISLDGRILSVILRTSLYRGSLNQGTRACFTPLCIALQTGW